MPSRARRKTTGGAAPGSAVCNQELDGCKDKKGSFNYNKGGTVKEDVKEDMETRRLRGGTYHGQRLRRGQPWPDYLQRE